MLGSEKHVVCPHCGAENPKSAIVTTCQKCLQRLAEVRERRGQLPGERRTARPGPGPLPGHARVPTEHEQQAAQVTGRYVQGTLFTYSPERPRRARARIPVRVHVTLYVLGPWMVGAAGAVLGVACTGRIDATGAPFVFVGLAVGLVAGFFSVGFVLSSLVLGRCPKCSGPADICFGRSCARCLGGRGHHVKRISYHCRWCGHTHTTSVAISRRRRDGF